MRSILVALAVLIGELVPRFDLIMGIIGGTLTGPLVFVLPPLFYAKIVRLEAAHDSEIARIRRNRTTLDDDSEDLVEDAATPMSDERVGGYYGTFGRQQSTRTTSVWSGATCCCCAIWRRMCGLMCSDYLLSLAVVVFGLAATVASTYFSALHVNSMTEFWSPCIHNISYSFDYL